MFKRNLPVLFFYSVGKKTKILHPATPPKRLKYKQHFETVRTAFKAVIMTDEWQHFYDCGGCQIIKHFGAISHWQSNFLMVWKQENNTRAKMKVWWLNKQLHCPVLTISPHYGSICVQTTPLPHSCWLRLTSFCYKYGVGSERRKVFHLILKCFIQSDFCLLAHPKYFFCYFTELTQISSWVMTTLAIAQERCRAVRPSPSP